MISCARGEVGVPFPVGSDNSHIPDCLLGLGGSPVSQQGVLFSALLHREGKTPAEDRLRR